MFFSSGLEIEFLANFTSLCLRLELTPAPGHLQKLLVKEKVSGLISTGTVDEFTVTLDEVTVAVDSVIFLTEGVEIDVFVVVVVVCDTAFGVLTVILLLRFLEIEVEAVGLTVRLAFWGLTVYVRYIITALLLMSNEPL